MGRKTKKMVAIIAAVFLLSNLFFIFASSLDKSTSKNVHTITLLESEIQKAVTNAKSEKAEQYNFLKKGPTQTVIKYGEKQSAEKPAEQKVVYNLSRELIEIADSLQIPSESGYLKEQLLKFFEGKSLVKFYKPDSGENKCKDCQILVVADNKTSQLYVVGMNHADINHSVQLTVQRKDGQSVAATGNSLQVKTVTQKTDIFENELKTFTNKENTTAELLDITKSYTKKTGEQQEPQSGETEKTSVKRSAGAKRTSGSEEKDTQQNEVKTTYTANIIEENTVSGEQEALPLGKSTVAIMGIAYQSTSAAQNGISTYNNGISTYQYGDPATLAGDKRAAKVENTDDLYQVKLEISGKNGTGSITESAPADVVVVLDLSSSMDTRKESGDGKEYYRWTWAKLAMNRIADVLLDSSADIEMAVVGFATSREDSYGNTLGAAHETFCGFTANKTTFKNSYNYSWAKDLINSGNEKMLTGTNVHAGMVGAQEILESRKNNNRDKYVILVSDGEPNAYYTKSTSPYKQAPYPDFSQESINAPIRVANSLKNDDCTVVAVGISSSDMTDTAKVTLSGIASSKDTLIYATAADLETTFAAIGNAIRQTPITKHHGNVTLTDNMSEHVIYVNEGATQTKLEYSENNGTTWKSYTGTTENFVNIGNGKLTWVIKNFNADYKYRITYYVRLKESSMGMKIHKDQTDGANPQAPNPNNAEEMEKSGVVTNGDTYLSSDEVIKQTVLVPTIYQEPKVYATPFAFKKIKAGTAKEALPGAKFMIYKCELNHAHYEVVTDEIVQDNSCWQPMLPAPVISDGNGKVDFGRLPDGQYRLVEVESPPGYEKPIGQWLVILNSKAPEGQKVTIVSVGNVAPPAFKVDPASGELYLTNMKEMELPKSGMGGIIPYMAGGAVIMMLSVGLFVRNRKKS